jgi:toxin ParE1/3/4
MTYAVRLGETAESDLRDIYEYVAYEIGEPEVAARLVRRFRKATEGLSTFDERNHLVEQEPWRSRNVRYTAVGNYLMFYAVDTEERTVSVMRFLYGGRDVWAHLSRLLRRATT